MSHHYESSSDGFSQLTVKQYGKIYCSTPLTLQCVYAEHRRFGYWSHRTMECTGVSAVHRNAQCQSADQCITNVASSEAAGTNACLPA